MGVAADLSTDSCSDLPIRTDAALSDVEVSPSRTRRNFVVLWSVYPIVWLLGAAGVGLMDVETASLVIVYRTT